MKLECAVEFLCQFPDQFGELEYNGIFRKWRRLTTLECAFGFLCSFSDQIGKLEYPQNILEYQGF